MLKNNDRNKNKFWKRDKDVDTNLDEHGDEQVDSEDSSSE